MARLPFLSFLLLIIFSYSHTALADSYHSLQKNLPTYQDKTPDWSVSVGAGFLVRPEYEGSEHYDFLPLPYIDVRYKNRLTLNPIEGLRYKIIQNHQLSAGVGLAADFGRDEDDDSKLRGLGDIDPTVEGEVFAKYTMDKLSTELNFSHDLAEGHEGFKIEAAMNYVLFASRSFFFSPSVSTTYVSENYMDSYFGINPEQARRSQFQTFATDRGLKDASLNVFARYALSPTLSINALASYSRLLGDAADSPITDEDNLFSTGAFLTYTFKQ
jgi:outer membrane scaffolding protein for murein synthesis (MipA/OmpV family)